MWKRTTTPSKPLLTVDDAKPHLCLSPDFTETDPLIQDYIDTALSLIDGPNGILGRCLITQSWQLDLDEWPGRFIHLHAPPIQSITSIKYYDTNGTLQTWAASNYVVTYTGHENSPAIIELAEGASWPSLDNRLGAVQITAVLGFGDTDADVPAKFRQLLRMLVKDMYDNGSAFGRQHVAANPVYTTAIANCRYIRFV